MSKKLIFRGDNNVNRRSGIFDCDNSRCCIDSNTRLWSELRKVSEVLHMVDTVLLAIIFIAITALILIVRANSTK